MVIFVYEIIAVLPLTGGIFVVCLIGLCQSSPSCICLTSRNARNHCFPFCKAAVNQTSKEPLIYTGSQLYSEGLMSRTDAVVHKSHPTNESSANKVQFVYFQIP